MKHGRTGRESVNAFFLRMALKIRARLIALGKASMTVLFCLFHRKMNKVELAMIRIVKCSEFRRHAEFEQSLGWQYEM